jgi:hypothetical protein
MAPVPTVTLAPIAMPATTISTTAVNQIWSSFERVIFFSISVHLVSVHPGTLNGDILQALDEEFQRLLMIGREEALAADPFR